MLHLRMSDKKELFVKICKQEKEKGKVGEEFLDAVYNEIERLYDVWDPLNGLTWNEQKEFDEHCNQWLKEIGRDERL